MIPRTIHYIWFGGAPIPERYRKFIDHWRTLMPDWEVICWDETNFDPRQCDYCREAYEAGRWAFVSDYARLKVLYDHGGIYLDTDEELIKPLDRFAGHKAIFGMEPGNRMQAGLLGCEPGSPVMRAMLDHYEGIHYLQPDGTQDNTVIGTHIAGVLQQLYPSFRYDSHITQELESGVVVYPDEYFCPDLLGLKIGENNYAVHRPMGSWLSTGGRLRKNLYILVTRIRPLAWLYKKIKR